MLCAKTDVKKFMRNNKGVCKYFATCTVLLLYSILFLFNTNELPHLKFNAQTIRSAENISRDQEKTEDYG